MHSSSARDYHKAVASLFCTKASYSVCFLAVLVETKVGYLVETIPGVDLLVVVIGH